MIEQEDDWANERSALIDLAISMIEIAGGGKSTPNWIHLIC